MPAAHDGVLATSLSCGQLRPVEWLDWAPLPNASRTHDGVFDEKDVCPCVPAPGGVDAQGRPLGDVDSDRDVDVNDHSIMAQNFTGPR